jgi:AbrB family looped-hinge helix DNA binding protein
MGKVTSKLQVTVPKAIADQFRIKPGDEIDWVAAGDGIRVQPRKGAAPKRAPLTRVRIFDEASERQRTRNKAAGHAPAPSTRGWTREELYKRGRPR